MKTPASAKVPSFVAIGTQLPELIELFNYVEDMQVWVKDRQGRFVWGNVSWLLTYGLTKDLSDHIGLTDFDLFVEVLASQYRIDDDKVLHGERIIARVELVGRFDHAARWYATTKIPLHNSAGRIVGTVGMTRPLQGERAAVPGNSPVSAAILYASEHLDEALSNHELARACGLSIRVFERLFQATYNTTPHLYVRQLRVRMSSRALVFTSKTLAEIAAQFGFTDQSHFTKEFRRFMDTTPRVYREQHQRASSPNVAMT
ncbi:MAG: HTH-type transcriptional activator RhaS [Verrucomicrobiota bacterium]|jgi:AraC-like DNA-binding protein